MAYGIQINTSAGDLDHSLVNSQYLDGMGMVVLTGITPTGNRVLTGFNAATHMIYVMVTGGYLPIWWVTGNTFYWESYNGDVLGMTLLILRKTF